MHVSETARARAGGCGCGYPTEYVSEATVTRSDQITARLGQTASKADPQVPRLPSAHTPAYLAPTYLTHLPRSTWYIYCGTSPPYLANIPPST
eukprot:171819-Rhodomonas_salina.1